jgi:hypothetical protein
MIVVQQTQRKKNVITIKVVGGMKLDNVIQKTFVCELDNVIQKTFVCVDGVVDQSRSFHLKQTEKKLK